MLADLQNVGILYGYVLGLSLAAPPGPVNAIIAVEATRRGWWPGFRVGLGATTGDVVFLLLFALGLGTLLGRSPTVQGLLNLTGAGIMLFFAWGALKTARAPSGGGEDDPVEEAVDAPGSGYLAGLVLVLTSPYNVAWWTTAGAGLLAQLGPPVIAGLFLGILTWVAAFPALLRFGETRVRGLSRIIAAVSAVILVAFGAWFAWQGAAALMG